MTRSAKGFTWRLASLLAGISFLGAMVGPANAAVPLWEDPIGDADLQQGLGISVPGGFDLVSGGIEKNGIALRFTVTHADMPPTGPLPEGFRLLWAFSVDEKASYRLTLKSADIGKPDVVAGSGNERIGRVDAAGHFRLEKCQSDVVGAATINNCSAIAYLKGVFDPSRSSVSVDVPLKAIKVQPGNVIGLGDSDTAPFCQICWMTHTADRSASAAIIDSALGAFYKVPR